MMNDAIIYRPRAGAKRKQARRQNLRRARCERLNHDYVCDMDKPGPPWFCSLHGCAAVDPDGQQPGFDHKGGCGCIEKII